MLSRVQSYLVVCFLFINVCVSQIHVVIDPHVAEKLFENKKQFDDRLGKKIMDVQNESQYFRLVLNDSVLYAGGRERLFTINLADFTVSNNVTFQTTTSMSMACKAKELLNGSLCYNYVTIIEPKLNGCLLVCGTDALAPKCYFIDPADDSVQLYRIGKNVAPRDPKQSSSWLYLAAESKYFTAIGIPVDGSGDSSGFQVANLSRCNDPFVEGLTQFNSPKWLNGPHFVGEPIEYGNFVYFFFREFATGHINAGRVVYSRVARVCKNDRGGKAFSNFENKFITYQKARLSCSASIGAGDGEDFMYNDIQDAYYYKEVQLVYTVFTASQPGPISSAICVYEMAGIASLFQTSAYWGTNNPENLWSTPSAVPTPRPGQCDQTYPTDNTFYSFLKNYPLFETFVPSTVTVVQDNVRYVKVVVEKVNSQTIMFLGTDRDTIVKAVFNGSAVEMIEEINLNLDGQPQSPILTIIKDDVLKSLYISTEYNIYKLPIETCRSRDPCNDCTKDPLCVISGSECVEYRSDPLPANTSHCNGTCIKLVYQAEAKERKVCPDGKSNVNFAVSASLGSNLSIEGMSCNNCTDSMQGVDEYQKKSYCGNEEILVVQYSFKVEKDCTCRALFTADDCDNVSMEIDIKVDNSKGVIDENCIKAVRSYDNGITLYQYKLQQWKNELIQETKCTENVCKGQTLCYW